jgi:hypothetical protein
MHTTRQIWYALGITFCVITAIIDAALITDHSAFFPKHSNRAIEGTNAKDLRTGTISVQTDPYHCEQEKFDNVTGRISDPRPCDNLGDIPMPEGTLHRLENIRKAFSGDRN